MNRRKKEGINRKEGRKEGRKGELYDHRISQLL